MSIVLSLRDSIASTFLGYQINQPESDEGSSSNKKPKKKPKKRKSGKKKSGNASANDSEQDQGYVSTHDESDGSDDEGEEFIPGMKVTVAAEVAADSDAKRVNAMVYNYQSTKLDDQINVMVKKIVADSGESYELVSEVVSKMFEGGFKYDSAEEVLKQLKALKEKTSKSGNSRRTPLTVDDLVHPDASPVVSEPTFHSAATTPVPAQPAAATKAFTFDRAVNPASSPAANKAVGSDTSARRSPRVGSHLDADAAAALAKLTVRPSASAVPVSKSEVESSKPVAAAPSQQTVEFTSMTDKINFVAAYSATNLLDSLSVLNTWMTTPSTGNGDNNEEKNKKIAAFFQSRALAILLSSFFNQEVSPLADKESPVAKALRALLQHVLINKVNDARSDAGVFFLLESLHQLAQQVIALRHSQLASSFTAPQGSAESPSGAQQLAQDVANCVRSMYVQLSHSTEAAHSSIHAHEQKPSTEAKSKDGDDEKDFEARLLALEEQLRTNAKNATKASSGTNSLNPQRLFLDRDVTLDKVQLILQSTNKLLHAPAPAVVATKPSAKATDANKSGLSDSMVAIATCSKYIRESTAHVEAMLQRDCGNSGVSVFSSTGQGSAGVGAVGSSKLAFPLSGGHQTQVDKIVMERDNKVGKLGSELSQCKMRLQDLSLHRQRLNEQLQMCEAEINMASKRADQLTNEINTSNFFYQNQIDQVAQAGRDMRKSIQVQEVVSKLVEAVRYFEEKFSNALLLQSETEAAHKGTKGGVPVITSATGIGGKTGATATHAGTVTAPAVVNLSSTSKDEDVNEKVFSQRRVQLQAALREHLAVETQCTQFLAERVARAQAKIATNRKELAAFAMINIKTSVTQQTENILIQSQREVAEDQIAMHTIQEGVLRCISEAQQVLGAQSPKATVANAAKKGTKSDEKSSWVTTDAPTVALLVGLVQQLNLGGVAPLPDLLVLVKGHEEELKVVPVLSSAAGSTTATPTVEGSRAETPVAADTKKENRDTKRTAGPRDEKKPSNAVERKREPRGGKDAVDTSKMSEIARSNATARSSASASGVDTTSAIDFIGKIATAKQKPQPAGKPVVVETSKPVAVPKTAPVAPISGVWGRSAAASADSTAVASDAHDNTQKSLKEIQEEQKKEKELLKQKQADEKLAAQSTKGGAKKKEKQEEDSKESNAISATKTVAPPVVESPVVVEEQQKKAEESEAAKETAPVPAKAKKQGNEQKKEKQSSHVTPLKQPATEETQKTQGDGVSGAAENVLLDLGSPLVEFHHAYPSASEERPRRGANAAHNKEPSAQPEEGESQWTPLAQRGGRRNKGGKQVDPVTTTSDETDEVVCHEQNPMLVKSPLVEMHATYPEKDGGVDEDSQLVVLASQEGGPHLDESFTSPVNGHNKLRDINPMARTSPRDTPARSSTEHKKMTDSVKAVVAVDASAAAGVAEAVEAESNPVDESAANTEVPPLEEQAEVVEEDVHVVIPIAVIEESEPVKEEAESVVEEDAVVVKEDVAVVEEKAVDAAVEDIPVQEQVEAEVKEEIEVTAVEEAVEEVPGEEKSDPVVEVDAQAANPTAEVEEEKEPVEENKVSKEPTKVEELVQEAIKETEAPRDGKETTSPVAVSSPVKFQSTKSFSCLSIPQQNI